MPDIMHLIRIKAPAERVYQALTTTEGITNWWTRDALFDSHAGGTGEVGFFERRTVARFSIEVLEPPAYVEWKTISGPAGWNGTTVTFHLRPAGNETVLSLAHRGFSEADENYARTTSGWGIVLTSLQQYVETGKGTPHPDSDLAGAKIRVITDAHTILATAELSAAPDRVFQALTTNEVETWWGAPGVYRITDWVANVVEGGRWSLMVRLPDGNAFAAGGKFLEIEAPRKLVQTRKYEWDHPTLGRRDTTVTYSLDATPTGTRVTVRHDGFGGLRAAADEHVHGWERVLSWLDIYMRSENERAAERTAA